MTAFKTIPITAVFMAAFFILGHALDGPSDTEAEAATAASLWDALSQAQSERPDLWTAETRARADSAALVVARGRH